MRYTIINFTRLGDLLQTQSTIAALKKQLEQEFALTNIQSTHTTTREPLSKNDTQKNEISLICLEQFVSAAHFIEELDDISIFPSSKILGTLYNDWRCAFQDLEQWVDAYYEKFPYDVVLNLTPSMNCRVFAQLLSRKASHINLEGFGLDSFGYGQNSSAWTTYIQAVTKERGCSPYNLIDGFRSMLGLAPEPFILKKPKESIVQNARAFLEQEKNSILTQAHHTHKKKGEIRFIAFQLGASNEVRQWDIQNFAQLGTLLWEKTHTIPILLGSSQDIPLAHAYALANKHINPNTPFINFCGKTTLEELGALLINVDALISNDTGTLHLAVGLGIPVVGIYLATAQVWDTGPYGLGHLCLEPRLDCHPCDFSHECHLENICRKSISAQTVFDGLSFLLSDNLDMARENISNKDLEKHNNTYKNTSYHNILPSKDARIWRSFFDESGFVSYTSLSGDENKDRTLWMACQRLFYKNFLERFSHVNATNTSPQNIQQNTNEIYFSKLSYENTPILLKDIPLITENIAFIERVLSFILLLKEQANMLHFRPSLKLQENFLASIERINLYLSQNASFTALSLLWKTLIQEHAHSIATLIIFFDTLHSELSKLKDFLIHKSH